LNELLPDCPTMLMIDWAVLPPPPPVGDGVAGLFE
jgi:hypothetical protein